MAQIRRKSLDRPDEVRAFPHGEGRMFRVGPLLIGRADLQPGWRWSVDVKPLASTASCQIHHLQILISGRFRAEMDDGEAADFEPGDVFEVPPGHDAWVLGDEPVVVYDVFGNVEDFAVANSQERAVVTLLMTDIVDSTATASRVGDSAWKQALATHNRVVRAQLERFKGHEVKTTGDGFLATFGSAVGALRAAGAIREATRALSTHVRVGVHTGEVEILPSDVRGLAVHATARVMALAGPSEIFVSSVTRGLVEGSDLRFEERGRYQLKGLDSPMDVYALVG
jgi:class 3 adenylate cyclase